MSFKKRILILFIGFILAIFSFEMFLRLDFFKPNQKFSGEITSPDKKIILSSGDSFVYGAGLNKGEDYPSMLNQALKNKGYQVINTGFLGPNTTQVYNRLKNDIKKYKPKIVLVQAGYTNSTNFTGLLSSQGFSIKYFIMDLRIFRFFRNLIRFSNERDDEFINRASWHIERKKSFAYQEDLPVKSFSHEIAKSLDDREGIIPAYLPGHFKFDSERFYSSIDYTEGKENTPGWNYLTTLDFKRAFEYFKANLKTDNDYKGIIMSLFKLSRYEEALKYSNEAVKKFPRDDEITLLWIKARAHNCEKDFSKQFVVKKLHEVLIKMNGDVSNLLVAGDLYKEFDNKRLAIMWYKKALELNSMASEPVNRLLDIYTNDADLENAKKILRIGKQNNPYNLEIELYEKRIDMMQEGNEKDLSELLSLKEKIPFVYTDVFVMDTLIMTSKLHNMPVVKMIDELLSKENGFSKKELLITKAYFLEQENNTKDAIKVYKELFEITNKISYLKIKADLLYNIGDIKSSIKEYERIENILPENKKYLLYFTLSYLYRKTNDFKGLIRCYKGMYDRFPENTNVWFALTDAYISKAQYQDADALLDKLLKKDIKNDFIYRMIIERKVDIKIHQGEYKEAIRNLKMLISHLNEKEKNDAYESIAEYYKVINEYENAQEYYKKAGDKNSLKELRYYLSEDQSKIFEWMKKDYKKIIRLCRENNARPIFINYFEWSMAPMKEVCSQEKVELIDVYKEFQKKKQTKEDYLSYFQTDGHLTKKGNELMVDYILVHLKDLK